MAELSRTINMRGAVWHRWEPHIHVPGTLLNNQYGAMSIDDFCTAIGALNPRIRALGITDYYITASYEKLAKAKEAGKLQEIDLLFPNVEIRLDVGTVQGSPINAHLLFSPDTPKHIAEINRFLAGLTFQFGGDDFNCTPADLKRLGKKHDPNISDDEAALREGANQFKVRITDIADRVAKNSWAQENMLIAVAASSGDGTSGVRTSDHAFDALRTTIESCCQIVFSGNPKDAEFWAGKGKLSPSQIETQYKSLKPCLHGSDAHASEKIGMPDLNRYSWIKGDVTFESLRQACLEPVGRAYVGDQPPRGGLVGETVQSLKVTNAPWMVPPEIHLNSGLVAIIGARGSGKTALADALAVGAYSMTAHANARSFIKRAETFLTNSKVTLDWESSEQTSGPLVGFEGNEWDESERVQYLSQQFVDELCASDGVADRLLNEIKRVIFNSHPELDREGTLNFEELYSVTCRSALDTRERCREELAWLTTAFVEHTQLKQSVADVTKKIEDAKNSVAKLETERKGLVAAGHEVRLGRHQVVQQALTRRKTALEVEQKKSRALQALLSELADFRTRHVEAWLTRIQGSCSDASLSEDEWNILLPRIDPQADVLLKTKLETAKSVVTVIVGPQVSAIPENELHKPLIEDSKDLDSCDINLLTAEANRLTKLIGIDNDKARRYANLTNQIDLTNRQIVGMDAQLKKAEQSTAELVKLKSRRRELYRAIFESFAQLAGLLNLLYSPLETLLSSEKGALAKMKFAVRRTADISAWAQAGEELFDLRKEGPFKGRGSLHAAALSELVSAWESGTPDQAEKAVDDFVKRYSDDLRTHKLDSVPQVEWTGRVWEWLFATDHIDVKYSLSYGDVDIENLSPGTRGIVLLLLYLAIDQEDMRPLIIDQPEENLDPQSVYDELVARFRQAKERRQIIVVTHNANLVVNADADQVIVVTAGEHEIGKLPEIKYEAGGLENPYIRQKVCEILEGGEKAFRERAKRLRIALV